MKLRRFRHEKELELIDHIARSLDGSDYDRGALESCEAQAKNVSEAFARLIEVLVNKNILDKKDVYQIVDGYQPREEL